VARLEVAAEDQVLARPSGHRRLPKISTPRWRIILQATLLQQRLLLLDVVILYIDFGFPSIVYVCCLCSVSMVYPSILTNTAFQLCARE